MSAFPWSRLEEDPWIRETAEWVPTLNSLANTGREYFAYAKNSYHLIHVMNIMSEPAIRVRFNLSRDQGQI